MAHQVEASGEEEEAADGQEGETFYSCPELGLPVEKINGQISGGSKRRGGGL